ncbi:hypothetical protein EZS27_034704, partial [termite gut metagenome]
GWVKVKGSIDGFEFKNYHLLPTVKGNGRLFLAIKAEIRKAIKKQAGDSVHIILYPDNEPLKIPYCCACKTTPKRCSFLIHLTKASSTITSSGYILQRQTKKKWTDWRKHLSDFQNVKNLQTGNKTATNN